MANSSSDLVQIGGTSPSRRQFFHAAGITAGGLCALAGPSLAGPWVAGAEAVESKQRAFVAGRFGLEIDGAFCGMINQFEGGNYTADVVSVTQANDRTPRKTLGIPRIEPITVEAGFDLSKPWYEWISKTMSGEPMRRSGAIIEMDQGFKEVGRRTFTNALLSEIEFPAFDATSKDQARMTVSITPEQLQVVKGSGKQMPAAGGKTKATLASNFRLNIQGLETATQKAVKIESFSIQQKVTLVQPAQSKVSQLVPGALEFPNLKVTVPEIHAGPLYAWLDDFLVKGNGGPTKERPGILEFLSADMKPFATVQLYGLGVFKIAAEAGPANSERARLARVEIYCQKMTATFTA